MTTSTPDRTAVAPSPQASPVRCRREGPAGWIELDRPEKANAYTRSMLQTIQSHLDSLESDGETRVVVVSAGGSGAFCAGADLNEMSGNGWRDAMNLKSAEVFQRLSRFPKVTLAAINGPAVGGGLELALACDLRIAADTATFSFPEPDLGLIPAAGGTQRLTEAVGRAKAKELILGGRQWSAEDALRFGLVSEVCDGDDLSCRVQSWAERIARRNPTALLLAKRAIDLAIAGTPGYSFESVAEALLYELRQTEVRSSTATH